MVGTTRTAAAALRAHREVWARKPALRAVYQHYFRRILQHYLEGPTLEVGAGPGTFKEYRSAIVATDIVSLPWLDAVADAQRLPFRQGSFANVVGFDVLHHVPCPAALLGEVARVLEPGGRFVLLEPAITPGSWLFYRYLHPEPVRFAVDPFATDPSAVPTDPMDANQAIPSLLFDARRIELERRFPDLRVCRVEHFGFVAYPASGSFRSWSLLPVRAAVALLELEDRLPESIGRWLGFRLLAVLEKRERCR